MPVPVLIQMTQADSSDKTNWDEVSDKAGKEESRLEFITGLKKRCTAGMC